MKRRNLLKLVPMALLLLSGCEYTITTSHSGSGENSNTNGGSSHNGTLENKLSVKDETVYVNLLPTGQVEEIEVVSRLENVTPGLYLDYGDFINVSNLTTLDSIVRNGNRIEIPVYEETDNFYYQSGLSVLTELPFIIEVSYYHNDVKKSPSEIKGSGGTIRIVIDITANSSLDPYFSDYMMCQLQVPVSLSKNKIISSEGATGIIVGKTITLAYMTLPKQSSHYEIELETPSFEMESMTASVSYFDLESMLDFDFGALMDNLSLFKDGLQEAAAGSLQIKDGISEVNVYLKDILEGLNEFNDGYEDFAEGLAYLVEVSSTLKNNLIPLVAGFNTLLAQGDLLVAGYNELSAGLFSFFEGIDLLLKFNATLANAVAQLKTGITEFGNGLDAYQSGLRQLVEGLNQWAEGYYQFADALPAIRDGSISLQEGAALLTGGLSELVANMDAFPEAVDALASGLGEMSDGFVLLDGKLDDFPISGTSEKPTPVSFTSPLNAVPRSVQFVYQVKGISIRQ